MERTELARVMELRQGAAVKRFHTASIIGTQTVAEHSHGVAMLLWQFFPHHATSMVLFACLAHDIPEGFVGDTPAPAKWNNPELGKALDIAEIERAEYLGIRVHLSDSEKHALNVCDCLEGILFAYEQIYMGNRLFLPVFHNYLQWFSKKMVPKPIEDILAQLTFSITSEIMK